MVVASLFLFAVGIAVAANAVGNLIGSLDMTAQRQTDLQRVPSGLLPPPPRQCPGACLLFAYTSSKTASDS